MMKNKLVFVLPVIFALLLSGCAGKTGSAVDEAAASPEPVVALSEAELDRVEELFTLMQMVDGKTQLNPLNCFLTSCYDSVEQIDMQAFLRYFPGSEGGGQAEFEALRALPGWPFANLDRIADMPVPLSRYDAESVRQALEKYAGLSLEDVDIRAEKGVYYLPEYDAFYNYTSDFGLEQPDFSRGEREGAVLRLYWQHPYEGERVLTLKETEGGYHVVSLQRIA